MSRLAPLRRPEAPVDAPLAAEGASVGRPAGDWAGFVSLIVSAVVFGPAFLISCLIAGVAGSFAFGALELGIVLSVFYATGAFASMVSGHWVDRGGARVPLVVATALTAASALGSGMAESWQGLIVMFGIAGCGAGAAGPAAVRLLVSAVAPSRWAVAFALRQSAVPFAGLVAGLFAATLQGYIGWRATFVGFAALCGFIAAIALVLGREGTVLARQPDRGRLRAETVALLISGAALLGAGVSAFAGFVVTSGIAIGMSPEGAALLLAGSSVAAILARLAGGWAADRRAGGHLRRVAILMLLGAISCAGVALAPGPVLFIPAVIVVSATAWSSNALFTYAVVKAQAHAPAKATSIVQIGLFSGSALGPFVFGFTTEHAGARAAWLLLALWLLAASAIVLRARQTFGIRADAAPPP